MADNNNATIKIMELPEPSSSKQPNSKQNLIDKNIDTHCAQCNDNIATRKCVEGTIMELTEPPSATVINNGQDIMMIRKWNERKSRCDDNTIKKPTKIDLASCGEPCPIPEDRTEITSPYEFTRLWQSIKDKNDLHSRANVLRRIPSEYLLRGKLIRPNNRDTSATVNYSGYFYKVHSKY